MDIRWGAWNDLRCCRFFHSLLCLPLTVLINQERPRYLDEWAPSEEVVIVVVTMGLKQEWQYSLCESKSNLQ